MTMTFGGDGKQSLTQITIVKYIEKCTSISFK